MRISRSAILIILGGLTIFFLGSSYTLWFNDDLIPFNVNIGGSPTPLAAATAGANGNVSDSVRLTVREAGITAVAASRLRDAGLDFAQLSSAELRLTKDGNDVPFLVRGENEEAVLYFYAQASDNPWEPLSVYVLRPGLGQEMAEREAQPDGEGSQLGQHQFFWEENRFFVDYAYGDDVWMGPLLMASDTWTFILDEIQPSNGPALLTVRLFSNAKGTGYPDHHVEILVNGQTVADHTWDGIKYETITATLEAGLLSSDEVNILSIAVHDDTGITAETVYVDDLELIYEGPISTEQAQVTFSTDASNILINNANHDLMVFDISDREAPVHLTELRIEDGRGQFAAGSKTGQYIALNQAELIQPVVEPVPAWIHSLHEKDWGADYIAIVADVRGFQEALDPLLAHRKAQGMRVANISLEQIYDEFGNGHRTPEAIRAFLMYTAAHWTPPAPRYVLLVGDATYDLTDQMPGKNRNHLPTPLVHSDRGGYVASDSWFSRFDGGGPLMATGRFPAQNAPQLRAMVDKTIRYEVEGASSEDDRWRERALLVADDEPRFDAATVDLAQDLSGKGYHIYRLQMSQSENIHYNILSAINQGVALVNYMGHGSKGAWGDEAVLQNSDVQALYNGSRLPILTALTSLNGAFAEPKIDSLAESLLRVNDGGVVAAIAPSGRANSNQMLPLAEQFYDQLLNGEGDTVGDALYQLMRAGESDPDTHDALVALNLLGDPGLRFYAP